MADSEIVALLNDDGQIRRRRSAKRALPAPLVLAVDTFLCREPVARSGDAGVLSSV